MTFSSSFCKKGLCIHILWWIFMGLGHNDPRVETHMWPQQMWGKRSSRGQWPLVQFFAKGHCIHILWGIFMGLGHNDPWVESHMWPQQPWGQRSSRGQWPFFTLTCMGSNLVLQWCTSMWWRKQARLMVREPPCLLLPNLSVTVHSSSSSSSLLNYMMAHSLFCIWTRHNSAFRLV